MTQYQTIIGPKNIIDDNDPEELDFNKEYHTTFDDFLPEDEELEEEEDEW